MQPSAQGPVQGLPSYGNLFGYGLSVRNRIFSNLD